LDLQDTLEVRDYSAAGEAVAISDAVIYAGGPIMDIPLSLVENVEVTERARAAGKPVLIEGVGIGPFKSAFSRWLARGLLRRSDRVRVRSRLAAGSPLLGRPAEVTRDPAMDYLATRGELTRLTGRERAEIQHALERPSDTRVIGVNVRPFWHKYAPHSQSEVQVLEGRFLEQLAEGLAAGTSGDARVRYVGFAMNADQYGFSDLSALGRLAGLASSDLDLRVLEIEFGVDGVLHLLRQLDGVVAMRFHACVFAIAEGVPVFGLDYAIGGPGKVGTLFQESGRGGDVVGVDEFQPKDLREWLNTTGGGGRPEGVEGVERP
jgi:polysaccharide pyruvyl transferase WcaK-like protein